MKNKTNKNKSQYYSVDLLKDQNGTFKVIGAVRAVGINQHKWVAKKVNARSLARDINRSSLVIN